ncbi:MAG TPA: hypothetical protein PKM32_01735 [Planctomycetota bacterium]|nr:hypothetical protein [Planctomycetota bacterium]HPY74207.1 hypothetical protein [Planctomycetota bacterium]HQB00036.1 hypothetical protein [Planctomycetota bacterium]
MALSLLTRKLQKIHRTIRKLVFILGVNQVFLASFIFFSIHFVLDYYLRYPWFLRFLLLIAIVWILILLVYRNLWSPYKKSISNEDILHIIEKRNPHLQEKLISAYQLEVLLHTDDYKDSRELTQKIIEDANELIPKTNFHCVVSYKYPILATFFSILSICCLLMILLTVAGSRDILALAMQRNMFLQNKEWPRKTHIFLLQDTYNVPINASTPLKITSHSLYSSIILWQRPENAKWTLWQQVHLYPENNQYTYTFSSVAEPMLFYLQTGDITTSVFKLVPVENSSVESIQMEYPFHTIKKARGESLAIRAYIFGKPPRKAQIHYTIHEKQYTRNLIDQDQRIYKYDFQTLTEDFTFYLTAGDDDDQIPLYRVRVLIPPTIETLKIWTLPPSYTTPNPTWTENTTLGNIHALIGTKALFQIKTNIPLQSAQLAFLTKESIPSVSFQSKAPLETLPESPLHYYAQCVVEQNTRYQIQLISHENLEDPMPTSFHIHAISDKAPTIQFIYPKEKNMNMTTKGQFVTTANIQDDYGITQSVVHYKINQQEWQQKILSTYEPAVKEVSVAHAVQCETLDKQPLKPGDSITYKLQAIDNKQPIPNMQESQTLVIDILDNNQFNSILKERIQEFKQQLKRIQEYQKDKQSTLQDYQSLSTFQLGEIAQFLQLRFAQQTITRDLSQQTINLDQIMQSIQENQLWKLYDQARFIEIQNLQKKLAHQIDAKTYAGQSYEIEQQYLQAYSQMQQKNSEASRTILWIDNNQQQIIDTIQIILHRLDQWEDLTEIIHDLDMILQWQKQMTENLKQQINK